MNVRIPTAALAAAVALGSPTAATAKVTTQHGAQGVELRRRAPSAESDRLGKANALAQEAARALRAGNAAQAEAAARAATQLEPAYGVAWLLLGKSLLELGRFADGEPALRKAREHRASLDPQQTATAAALLVQALIQLGSAPDEAVQLAYEAAAATPSLQDASSRAWHLTLIGRAFGAAGNRACALKLLDEAEAVADAPEKLRTEARSLRREAEAWPPARPDCFAFELYRRRTLSETWRAYRADHPQEQEPRTITYEVHPVERVRTRLHFTGARRPLSKELALMLTEFAGGPPGGEPTWKELGQRYRSEAEVVEQGVRRWIAIQELLGPALAAELPNGGDAEAYVIFYGAVNGEPIFFLTEFDASPAPG